MPRPNVFDSSPQQAERINPGMPVKALVLDSDDRLNKVFGNVVDRDVLAVQFAVAN